MRKRIITLIALAFAAFGLLGPTAASAGEIGTQGEEIDYAVAHSVTDPVKYCDYNYDAYVIGCFQPYGDVLWLQDTRTDGHHVTLVWEDLDGPRYGKCIDNLGADVGTTRCNKDLPENHRIKWNVKFYYNGSWVEGASHTTMSG